MARRGPLPHNIMRRGNSYVVHMKGMRPDGGLHWVQFSDKEHGGKEGSFAAADLERERLEHLRRRGQRAALKLNVDFATAAEAWFEHGCTSRNWRPSTAADYRSALDSRLLREFGDTKLSDLSETRIADWLAMARQDGLSPRTLQKLLTIMVGIFKRAHRAYGFSGNPAAEVERITQADRPALQVFEPEEVWKLVRAADDEQDAAIFLTAAFAGLRMGEFPPLTVKNIDNERSTIRVEASVTRGLVSMPKSKKVRSVPMVDEVAQAIAKLLTARGNPGPDELVFPGEDGGFLNTDALRNRYVAARDRAGLRPLTFHQLRHSFGSVAIDKLSAVEVQHAMGHASLQTTQRYLHFRDSRDLASRLQGAFALEPAGRAISDEELADAVARASDEELDEAARLIDQRRAVSVS
jgi:integrase